MAKLKAPLLSFGASGAIAKAIVYFSWKGLNVAREYVIPANPRTVPQTTQRGHLSALVTAIHLCQALEVNPLDAQDISAFALLGSTYPTPRTWFNQVVKQGIDQKVAGKNFYIQTNGHLTPGTDKLTFELHGGYSDGESPTDGFIYWGTSKTALINTIAATIDEMAVGKDIPGLTTGVKYYAKFKTSVPGGYVGTSSGIYYGVPL